MLHFVTILPLFLIFLLHFISFSSSPRSNSFYVAAQTSFNNLSATTVTPSFPTLSPSSSSSEPVSSCPSLGVLCTRGGSVSSTPALPCSSISGNVGCSSSGWYLPQSSYCTCGTGQTGPECRSDLSNYCNLLNAQLPATATINDTYIWDTSVWNPNYPSSRPLSCFITETEAIAAYNMHLQFARITAYAHNSTIIIQAMSQVSLPGDGQCTASQNVITCTLSQCVYGSSSTGGLNFQCAKHVCDSSACTQGCGVFAFMGQAVTDATTDATFTLTTANTNTSTYNADGVNIKTAVVTGSISISTSSLAFNLPVQCEVGQCIPYRYRPSDPPTLLIYGTTTSDSTYPFTVAIVAIITAVWVGVGLTALLFHRYAHRQRIKFSVTAIKNGGGRVAVELTLSAGVVGIGMAAEGNEKNIVSSSSPPSSSNPSFGDESDMIELPSRLRNKEGSAGVGGGSLVAAVTSTVELDNTNNNTTNNNNSSSSFSSSMSPHTQQVLIRGKRNSTTSPASSSSSISSGIRVLIQNLNYSVCESGGATKTILKNLNADIPPGMLVALLGPSGAGKSTLLNILAGWKRGESVSTGTLQLLLPSSSSSSSQRLSVETRSPIVSAPPLRSHLRRDRVAMVLQDELLLPSQTVREAVTFSAQLRLPTAASLSPQQLHEHVEQILCELNIDHLADHVIGSSEDGGLSGGERRRVAMAIELVSEPGLLLMDEPLSGLDSSNAELCLRTIQRICHANSSAGTVVGSSNAGCGCILSIHQSSHRLLSYFDRLLLLSRTGELLYYGTPHQVDPYFSALGYQRPLTVTISEFLLELAMHPRDELIHDLVDAFRAATTVAAHAIAMQQPEFGQGSGRSPAEGMATTANSVAPSTLASATSSSSSTTITTTAPPTTTTSTNTASPNFNPNDNPFALNANSFGHANGNSDTNNSDNNDSIKFVRFHRALQSTFTSTATDAASADAAASEHLLNALPSNANNHNTSSLLLLPGDSSASRDRSTSSSTAVLLPSTFSSPRTSSSLSAVLLPSSSSSLNQCREGATLSALIAEASTHTTAALDAASSSSSPSYACSNYVVISPSQSRVPVRSWWYQFHRLVMRSMQHTARQPQLLAAHLIVTTVAAIFLGFLFYQVDFNIGGIQNRAGFLFAAEIFFSLTALSCLSIFLRDRARAHHEQLCGHYSTSSFFLAHLVSDWLPLRILPSLIFAVITYNLVGLQSVSSVFLLFVVTIVLMNLSAVSFCLAITSCCETHDTATFISVVFLMTCLIFGGLLVNANTSESPSILVYLQYLSFNHFAYEPMFTNEFSNINFLVNGQGIPETVVNGVVFISNFGMDSAHANRDYGILLGMIVAPLLFAAMMIHYRYRARLRDS